MYQFEATVYEIKGGYRYQGALYLEANGERKVLVSGHCVRLSDGFSEWWDHEHILEGLRTLCDELAVNLDNPLF